MDTARTIQSRLNTARTIKSSWIQQGQYTVKLDTARTIIQSSWIQQGLLDTQYRQVGYRKEYWIHNTVRLDTSRSTGYTISSGWIQQGVLDTQYCQVGYIKEYWIHNIVRLDITRN